MRAYRRRRNRRSVVLRTREGRVRAVGATRFFVAGVHAVGDAPELAPDDARKLVTVLRCADGDALEVVDSSGRAFAAVLRLAGKRARAELLVERAEPPGPRLRLVLAQGIPKLAKMDFVVEKATELGVERILPFTSERTEAGAMRDGKLERWRRVARSAAQQCGRRDVPLVAAPQTFAELVATFAAYDFALVPWEVAEPVPLRDVLPPLVRSAGRALVAIGPEGGFSAVEARAARDAGAHVVSLGTRILRTETAGLVACSALRYATGDL